MTPILYTHIITTVTQYLQTMIARGVDIIGPNMLEVKDEMECRYVEDRVDIVDIYPWTPPTRHRKISVPYTLFMHTLPKDGIVWADEKTLPLEPNMDAYRITNEVSLKAVLDGGIVYLSFDKVPL